MNGYHCAAALVALLSAGCGDDRQTAAPETGAAGRSVAAAPARDGRMLFETYCLACHGEGISHPGTMRLQERLGEEQAALLARRDLQPEYVKFVVREGFRLMPPFRPSEITDSELERLADYLAAARH